MARRQETPSTKYSLICIYSGLDAKKHTARPPHFPTLYSPSSAPVLQAEEPQGYTGGAARPVNELWSWHASHGQPRLWPGQQCWDSAVSQCAKGRAVSRPSEAPSGSKATAAEWQLLSAGHFPGHTGLGCGRTQLAPPAQWPCQDGNGSSLRMAA